MTLVAAYRPEGIPVLIGDFLITGGSQESTKKKIHKIGPNFVIGWAGRRILAIPILRALFETFGNQSVTIAEVEKFLTSRPSDELNGNELYLVGWVVEEIPHCFLWNIANPDQLFFDTSHIIGTGERKFQELLLKDTLGGSFGSQRTTPDQAIYSALAIATELYADENLDKMNRRQGFGHGYEVLYFDGNEFQYIENIAFFGMDILLNTDDFSGRSHQYEHWYRYHSLGNSAFLQTCNLRTGHMALEVIEPAFRYTSQDASFDFTAGSFHAAYYCIYLRLQTMHGETLSGSIVLPENEHQPSRYAKEENGNYRFELGRDLIKFMYESVKAEIEHRKIEQEPFGCGSAETVERAVGANSAFQVRLAQNDKRLVIGLISTAPWNKHFESMEYAMMACADARLQIYEKGVAVGPLNVTYRENDVFTISIEGVTSILKVRYYVNSKFVYQSSITPALPLKGAICLKDEGATVSESRIVGLWSRAANV